MIEHIGLPEPPEPNVSRTQILINYFNGLGRKRVGCQIHSLRPFANFVAEVEKIAPDRRVWVLMELMGGQTRVAVGADQLRAL
jgi:hypothetical protein